MSPRQGLAEVALFLAAAAAGVYGLGEGLGALFGQGQGGVPWLGVTAVALMVLARQMARVQDRAPHRGTRHAAAPGAPDGGPIARAGTSDEGPPAGPVENGGPDR